MGKPGKAIGVAAPRTRPESDSGASVIVQYAQPEAGEGEVCPNLKGNNHKRLINPARPWVSREREGLPRREVIPVIKMLSIPSRFLLGRLLFTREVVVLQSFSDRLMVSK